MSLERYLTHFLRPVKKTAEPIGHTGQGVVLVVLSYLLLWQMIDCETRPMLSDSFQRITTTVGAVPRRAHAEYGDDIRGSEMISEVRSSRSTNGLVQGSYVIV
jgi:hypothetical protein